MQQERSDRFPSCDVCGRTILKGEQVYEYVTPQGQRLGVCILCRSRAESSGWIPAEEVGSVAHPPPSRARRGQVLRQRLGRAAARARASAGAGRASRAKDSEGPQRAEKAETAARSEKAEERPKRQPGQRATKPKAKPRAEPQRKEREAAPRPRRARRGPQAIMRRAVERFNGSDEPRKVAGLIRSLGEPRAAVRPDASRQLALVTIAWELSWYQWEVSGDGEGESVREVAKGDEVSELSKDVRTWNAAVAEDGKLRLRTAPARRKSSAKEA